MSENSNSKFQGFLLVFIGSILFSTKAVLVKMAFRDTTLDPISLLALRMLFAFPFFLVAGLIALRKHKAALPNQKQWMYIIAMGVLGYYLSSLLDFIGLKYISAGLERLILFLYPSFVVLMNVGFFKEKFTARQKLALSISYLGLLIAFVHEMQLDVKADHFIIGTSLIFLCAITYAGYNVGTGRLLKHIPVMVFTPFALLSSTGGVFIHYLLSGPSALNITDGKVAGFGILLGLIATVLPTYLISGGIKRIGASDAAIVSSIGPVSTIILAFFFLGDTMDLFQIIGTLLVIAGVLLVNSGFHIKNVFSGLLNQE